MAEKTENNGSHPLKSTINFNTIVAVCLIIFSIVAFLMIPYQIEKPKLFMGRSLTNMTPSLFPRLSIVGLFILSIWYLTHSFHLKEKNLFKELGKQSFVRILVTYAVFALYAVLLEPLGFIVSSALMVSFLMFYYGNRNLIIFFVVLIGAPLSIYYIFTRLLQVSLPEGILF